MASKTYYATLHVGQSNNEPTAPRTDYFALVSNVDYTVLTPDGALGIYYGKALEKVHYLTFYSPEGSASFPGGSPPSPWDSYAAYAKWLPLTHLQGVANPNIVGFRYPNGHHQPRDALGSAFPDKVSATLDIAWRLHTEFGTERMHVINSSIGATTLHPREEPINATKWGWFEPRRHQNWSPADPDGLAARLLLELRSAKTAAELEDANLEILMIHVQLGESDAFYNGLAPQWPANMNRFVDWIRKSVFDLGLSSVGASRIPVIWEKVQLQFSATNVPVFNEALAKRERDDPFFGTIEIDGVTTVDGIHSDAAGIRLRGQRVVEKFRSIRRSQLDQVQTIGLPTLADLRTMVRMEVERNTTSTNYQDAVVDHAINLSLDHLYKHSGDLSWWLRTHTQFDLNSDGFAPVTLPLKVSRLLKIIPVDYPDREIDFQFWGHTDNGHLQVLVDTAWVGSVFLRHIQEPATKLIATGDIPALPAQYIETLVLGAAWRCAQTSGNANLEVKFKARAMEALERMMGHVNKVARQERATSRARRRTSIWPWR